MAEQIQKLQNFFTRDNRATFIRINKYSDPGTLRYSLYKQAEVIFFVKFVKNKIEYSFCPTMPSDEVSPKKSLGCGGGGSKPPIAW